MLVEVLLIPSWLPQVITLKSLYETDMLKRPKIARSVSVPLPEDVVVAKEFAETATATIKSVKEVADDDMILDIVIY